MGGGELLTGMSSTVNGGGALRLPPLPATALAAFVSPPGGKLPPSSSPKPPPPLSNPSPAGRRQLPRLPEVLRLGQEEFVSMKVLLRARHADGAARGRRRQG